MNKARTVRRELVETELLERAAELFGARGFSGTTLQDVADTVGLTRATLYHYFDSKDALLAALVEDIVTARAAEIKAVRTDVTLTAPEKLGRVTATMVRNVASHAARFRLLLQTENDLPPDLAAKHARSRLETLKELVALFEEGVRAGELRATDPHLAAFALLGMCNWIAWWFKPDHQTVDAIADEYARIALAAYGAGDAAGNASAPAVRDAVQRLRAELSVLERLV